MRVLVTGVGIVSPLGPGARDNVAAVLEGRVGLGPLSVVEVPGLEVPTVGEVSGGLHAPHGWSRAEAMAVTAACEAVDDAALTDRSSTLLFVGGSSGGMLEAEATLAALATDAAREDYDRDCIPSHVLNAPADRVHRQLGPFSAAASVCSACSGGSSAIALAAAALRAGWAEVALAGGVDALCRMNLAGFAALGAFDVEPCRPFDRTRAGLSLAEGAAFVVLETEEFARARGARPIVELAGWAMRAEAHHITQPAPDGGTMESTMRQALERASLAPSAIDYVSAHGTATPHNDPVEARAIGRVLGSGVSVSSLKGHVGHSLAAAGAIEASVTALCVERGVVPSTAGLSEVDPGCEVVRHPRGPEHRPIGAALSNAFGFGGTDVVLALRAPTEGDVEPAAGEPVELAVTRAVTLGPLGLGADPWAYCEEGPPPVDAPLELPVGALDAERARRFDRASRLATIVAAEALPDGVDRRRCGVVVGSAFGSATATGSFLRRIFDKGMRFASPALFPNVLPSAMAANASIYLGLEGPALSCADTSTSAEAALRLGSLLVADGQADTMLVVAAEEHDPVAARVSSPRISDVSEPRGEGAVALLVERAQVAREAGRRPLASLAFGGAARGAGPIVVPEPSGRRPLVVRPRRAAGKGPPPASWRDAPTRYVTRAGDHESVGGFALAAAVSAVAGAVADDALVAAEGPDRRYAFVLKTPGGNEYE